MSPHAWPSLACAIGGIGLSPLLAAGAGEGQGEAHPLQC